MSIRTDSEDDAVARALQKTIFDAIRAAAENPPGKPMNITNLTIPLLTTVGWLISNLPLDQRAKCIKQCHWLLDEVVREPDEFAGSA